MSWWKTGGSSTSNTLIFTCRFRASQNSWKTICVLLCARGEHWRFLLGVQTCSSRPLQLLSFEEISYKGVCRLSLIERDGTCGAQATKNLKNGHDMWSQDNLRMRGGALYINPHLSCDISQLCQLRLLASYLQMSTCEDACFPPCGNMEKTIDYSSPVCYLPGL